MFMPVLDIYSPAMQCWSTNWLRGKCYFAKYKTGANFLGAVHKPYLHHSDHMAGIQEVNDGPGGKLEAHFQPEDETDHHQQHILAQALLLSLGLLQMTLQLPEVQLPELPQGQEDLHDAHAEEDQTLQEALLPREKGRALRPPIAGEAGVHPPVHPVQEIAEAVARHAGTAPLLPVTVQEQAAARWNQSQNTVGLTNHELQGRPLCSPLPSQASAEAARPGARLICGFSLRCQDQTCKQEGRSHRWMEPVSSGQSPSPQHPSSSSPGTARPHRSPLRDRYGLPFSSGQRCQQPAPRRPTRPPHLPGTSVGGGECRLRQGARRGGEEPGPAPPAMAPASAREGKEEAAFPSAAALPRPGVRARAGGPPPGSPCPAPQHHPTDATDSHRKMDEPLRTGCARPPAPPSAPAAPASRRCRGSRRPRRGCLLVGLRSARAPLPPACCLCSPPPPPPGSRPPFAPAPLRATGRQEGRGRR